MSSQDIKTININQKIDLEKDIATQFGIYIITWNVSSKFPDNVLLNDLLGLGANPSTDGQLPDMYIIGLQEVNSQPQNQVLGLFQPDPWTSSLKDTLNSRDFIAIKTEQMQGLLLILFTKRKHLLYIRNIEAEFTRTGLGGIWGNKGAVSIRLSLYGCGVAFVNAHLAAHDHELDERIEDFNQILDNHRYHVPYHREIFDHSYVFWFGDLNFRLQYDDDTTPEEVRDLVEKDHLKELMERDQLLLVRNTGRAFFQLQERMPEFPPTFKFEKGSLTYDMKRRPAWTDRILWKAHTDANNEFNVEQKSYKCHPGYDISDHKPVTSEFQIRLLQRQTGGLIEFSHIPIWNIGDENLIEFSFHDSFEEENADWIGIYHHNFSSLSDYVAYEYTNQAGAKKQIVDLHESRKSIRMEFSETIDLMEGEKYLLIYISNTGIRGVTSICGISNIFQAETRPPSPRFEAVD